ncbi:MAG: NAD(+)/NADH kinase [Patescibacteria group bacterium]|nr:NAD(+)/NADH kinase [Patescibacteria group bacterium]
MKQAFLLTNQDKRSQEINKWFKGKGLAGLVKLVNKPAPADFFVAAGGDGTLLRAISLFRKYNKPFFGINCGTSGFLLNQIDSAEELAEVFLNFSLCKLIKLNMLQGDFIAAGSSQVKSFYAFNDFYIKATQGNERIIGTIRGDKNFPKHEFDGDGIIISTPQGSTAYNYAAGGAIISLGANQLAIKSVCAKKSLRAVVPDQGITVEIERGQATAYADHGKILTKVKKFKVKPSREAVKLAFKPGYDFELKRWHV